MLGARPAIGKIPGAHAIREGDRRVTDDPLGCHLERGRIGAGNRPFRFVLEDVSPVFLGAEPASPLDDEVDRVPPGI